MGKVLHSLAATASIGTLVGLVYLGMYLRPLDLDEIPIIRKSEIPLRVTPENPGGLEAEHQGFSVNIVQSDGGVAAPALRVILAPMPVGLEAEDLTPIELSNLQKETLYKGAKNSNAIDNNEVITGVADNIKFISTGVEKEIIDVLDEIKIPRALMRPKNLTVLGNPKTLDIKDKNKAQPFIKIGSKLVQLGAFSSYDIAESQWSKILKKHSDLLDKKDYIIQSIKSNGRGFYGLRVIGFATIKEAKSLCAALKSRKEDCFVVTAQ